MARRRLEILSEEQSGMFLCYPVKKEKWSLPEADMGRYRGLISMGAKGKNYTNFYAKVN